MQVISDHDDGKKVNAHGIPLDNARSCAASAGSGRGSVGHFPPQV